MPQPKQRVNQTAACTASSGEVRRKHGGKETIGTGTRGGIGTGTRGGIGTGTRVAKDRAKENIGPSRIRHDSPVIQEPGTATEPQVAGEKKHTKSNASSSSQWYGTIVAASAAEKKPTKGNTYRPSGSLPRTSLQRRAARSPKSSTHDRKDSAAANKTAVQEADDEIRKLNELGLGEDISYEDYSGYLGQLPCKPDVDTSIELDSVQLKELDVQHALYRIRYFKLSQQVSENELCYDKLKEDFPLSLLEKEDFFERFEEDGTLDWFFHPDYRKLAALDDYQRLVPQNYGGHEYVKWNAYHKHFYSYEVEQEYIKFCEELSNKLKWIEAYVPNETPSLKWGRILTRGTYQAIKIAATGFSKITRGLAFSGFHEWLNDMSFDVCWYNEFDGVYYEIWQRVTKQKKSFRDALDEVYKLNKFPLRQHRMKCALGNDTYCSDLKEEFLACTACLTKEVTEDKARELIAEAVRKEMEKPKFYVQYCRKKIHIARAIGLISRD